MVLRQRRNLGGSHHRTPGVRIPSLARLRALQFVLGCFQMAYGDFRCLDGRMVGVGTRASQGLGRSAVEFDVSVDGFPEQGR